MVKSLINLEEPDHQISGDKELIPESEDDVNASPKMLADSPKGEEPLCVVFVPGRYLESKLFPFSSNFFNMRYPLVF